MPYDFSGQNVTRETTAEYTFTFIPGNPRLVCSPAHDSNADYHRARLRVALEDADRQAAQPRSGGRTKPTVESLMSDEERERAFHRKVAVEACIRDWGKAPVDADGKTHPFSPKEAADFIAAVPDWMFDNFWMWVGSLLNFVDRPPISEGEADELGNG